MRRVSCLCWILACPVAAPAPAASMPYPAEGSYAGEISLRGDRWAARLHLTRAASGPRATLDLPELVMAGEEIEVRCEDGSLLVNLPFGLGEVALSPKLVERPRVGETDTPGIGLTGRRPVADTDTLAIELAPAGPPPYETREIRFGDDPSLAGTLYLPASAGPHPGVVLVHGSGPQGRDEWSYRSWADLYARLGLAALVYDKRGVGGSGGDFRADSAFVGLTEDALAAVRALRASPGVDPRRVGIGGASQAAWISARAAARDPAIAFLALTAAPAVSVAEQELQRVEAGMRAAGLDEPTIGSALAHTRLLFSHLATGERWEELAASSRRIRTDDLARWVHTPDSPSDLRWWRTHWRVDPEPDLRALRIPVLALYSREDPVVPAAGNARRMERLLEGGGADATVVTVPRGDHRLELDGGPDALGRWRFPRVAPRALAALESWVRSRVLPSAPDLAAFVTHVRALAPGALARTDASALAVALVREGEIAWIEGFGAADPATGEPVTAATLFNVGSIAKTVSAWGVLELVERGKIDPDAPVSEVLDLRPLASSGDGTGMPDSSGDDDGITVRRLLSHTAGLDMGATPETAPGDAPELRALLADSLHRIAKPGSGWRYSGGGYGLLQLLVEHVTGRPFAEYMRTEILEPLGMTRSFFGWRPELAALAAAPRDEGGPAPWHDHPVLAAAGLWSTPEDLARFAAASLPGPGGEPPGRGVLTPGTVDLLTKPAPSTERRWGLRYGLGYGLWPTTEGRFAAGHRGQNVGWSAALWTLPDRGDAIVLLTNASDGADGYRWMLCDWVAWAARAPWGGYCADRREGPRGTLDALPPLRRGPEPRLPWVDSLLAARLAPRGPGAAVAIRRGDTILHAAGYGVADRATGEPITPDTPFYLASLAKPWTAIVVLRLVEDGRLSLDARLGDLVPELDAFAGVTVRQLLTHTSGIPDYYAFIEWSRFRGLDDAAVIDTLRRHPEAARAPGRRFSYSNSNYVLLAEIVRRATGRPFAEAFERMLGAPSGLGATAVGKPPRTPRGRAVGYTETEDPRVSDWAAIELPFGPVVEYALGTTGAGGVFSSVRDLIRLEGALSRGRLVSETTAGLLAADPVPAPELDGPGEGTAYGLGWVVSELDGRELLWHDGNFAGFSSALIRVPELDLCVAVLSNRAGGGALRLARDLLGELVRRGPG